MMKKNFFFLMIALVFVACSNDSETIVEYGQIKLDMDISEQISVNTRAASDTELANYTLTISQNATQKWNGLHSAFISESLNFPAAAGYVVAAENCTEAQALSANSSWGQLRIAGESASFSVVANTATPVAFTCSVKNAIVGVDYQESFKSAFTNFSVEVNESSDAARKLVYPGTATFDSHKGYFNIDSNPQISYVVKGTIGGSAKTYDGTLAIEAAKYYRLKVSATTNGEISLSITIDETITEESKDVTVDPYQ